MNEELKKQIETEIVTIAEDAPWKHMPFDQGLPLLRADLWAIADRHGVEGAEVLEIYMEDLAANKSKSE